MLEAIFEVLFEFIGEFILQVVFELLAEVGLQGARNLRDSWEKEPNTWLAGAGYTAMGAGAGALSLWLVPALFIASPQARLLNLLITPVASGAAMMAIGALRAKRGQTLIRLDRFSYGFIFALAMAGVRFWWGH